MLNWIRPLSGEDKLLYGEPPEWSIPARQDQGQILLAAGRPVEAEQAFREDMQRFRDNGWSLSGLAQALQDQGPDAEAAEVLQRFQEVWESADVNLAHR